MATTKPYLDTRSKKKDNTYPVKIAIRHKNETVFLPTEISVTPEQWEDNKVTGHPKASSYNKAIRSKLIRAENTILTQSSAGTLQSISAKELKALIENNGQSVQEPEPEPEPQTHDLDLLFRDYAKKCRKPKTAELYLETLGKINSFRPNTTLEEVNKKWLEKFDEFMSDKCSINTRGIHMRNLRAIFNDAIDEDVVDLSYYPFRKFKIEKEDTFKRSLTIAQIKQLRDYKVEPHQERYRDLFMLSFYLIGINMVDLLNLKHSDLIDGRIEYTRAKTYRLYSIEVLPEAMQLIEKYKGQNYLINIMDSYTNYKDFMARMDENLKEIGKLEWITNKAKEKKFRKKNKKKYTPLFPGLSSYWARHTWATIGASKTVKIPKDDIAKALGHGPKTTTDIYIRYDLAIIDEANKKVLEAIL